MTSNVVPGCIGVMECIFGFERAKAAMLCGLSILSGRLGVLS
jgi:hypothetical protein